MPKTPMAGRAEWRDPAALKPHPRNSRTHDDAQIEQIVASIRRFGFTRPVVVDEGDVILAGHGATLAAVQAGVGRVPVVVARGWSEEQKRAYVIADNQLAQKSSWDTDLLKLELAALDGIGIGASDLGFTPVDLAVLFPKAKPAKGVTAKQIGDLEYRLVVDCRDEEHQAEMLAKLESEGLTCRALIS